MAMAVPEAPVYRATMAEMEDLAELLARAGEIAREYGAVRIDPPAEWVAPALRMGRGSRFFVRLQTLPERESGQGIGDFVEGILDGVLEDVVQAGREMGRSKPKGRGRGRERERGRGKVRGRGRGRRRGGVGSVAMGLFGGLKGRGVRTDEKGRLAEPVVFPDSIRPITLSAFERGANQFERDIKGDVGVARDVQNLEDEFWSALARGVHGKNVTIPYGVDVEAEGAYDSYDSTYLEWLGAGCADSAGSDKDPGRSGAGVSSKVSRRRIHSECEATEKELVPVQKGRKRKPNMNSMGVNKRARVAHMPYAEDHGDGNGDGDATETIKRERLCNPHEPKCHVGNINQSGILRHLPRMPGINHSMYYIGQLFTRFCWHTEDAFLNSVSYLHPGSADKVWYAVPPGQATAFESYASEEVFAPEMMASGQTGQTLLMNKTAMFDPRNVLHSGVPVFKVIHKPGSFVLTAPRAYHAGFNCGFNVAEAVNFAAPDWFPSGRLAAECARANRRPLCVPQEYLLFHEALSLRKEAVCLLSTGSQLQPVSKRIRANAGIVARELRHVIDTGEQAVREYATASNCRVVMLPDAERVTRESQLGPEFGNGAGFVCAACGHAAHFYAEVCGTCTQSVQARCSHHFGCGGRVCSVPGHRSLIVRRHDPVLLIDLLGELERLAGVKVAQEVLLERHEGYVRCWQTPMRSCGLRLRMNLMAAARQLVPRVAGGRGGGEGSGVRGRGKRGRGQTAAVEDKFGPVKRKKRRRKSAQSLAE